MIHEKATLSSQVNELNRKLDVKQGELDWLRDHRLVTVQAVSGTDPNLANLLNQFKQQIQGLKDQPAKALKLSLYNLSSQMASFFRNVSRNADNLTHMSILGSNATVQERQAEMLRQQQAEGFAAAQMDSDIQAAMIGTFDPRAVVLLEELRSRGEASSGIRDEQIDDALSDCSSARGSASYWHIQSCAEKLAVLGQRTN